MNKRVLFSIVGDEAIKIDPFCIPYIDDIKNDYLWNQYLDNIGERNKTVEVGIETDDFKKVKKGLCEEMQERTGEHGIQEIARHYRRIRDDEIKHREEERKRKFELVKSQLYDYLITTHPQAVEGLSHYEVLTHINHFMRSHPEWVSKEIQHLKTF